MKHSVIVRRQHSEGVPAWWIVVVVMVARVQKLMLVELVLVKLMLAKVALVRMRRLHNACPRCQ
jgi:uncharacterized membrane protein YhaH (DUF805 family)